MIKQRLNVQLAGFALVLLGLLISPPTPITAQDATGTVTGRVLEASTQRPLTGVQVSIPELSVGAMTGTDGRYSLERVTPGDYVIQANMIGHSVGEQEVTVGAGASATVDFLLSQRAISLDEMVVTGSAGATERRTLGNSISTVNAAEVMERLPVVGVDELFKGRTAGVNMNLSSGTVGTGGNITIRGTTSISLAGDPVIYIDGVRANASDDRNGVSVGGQTISRIADLQPSEIERIEIVKGAAAATLYGTQGANGVIQVFTKRGRTGAPQWNFELEQGFERQPTDRFPGRLWTEFTGPDGYQARDPKEIVGNGHHQRYSASVSGGSETLTYFVSGSFKRAEASIAPDANWLRQGGFRVNLNAAVTPKLTVGVTSGLVSSRLRIPDNDNALHGLYSQVVAGVPYTATEDRPWGERFGSFYANQTLENHQEILRNTTGLTLEYLQTESVRHFANVGVDWFVDEFTKFFPYGYEGSGNLFGSKRNHHRNFRDITLDYRLSLSNDLTNRLSSELSVGAQGNFTNTIRVDAQGINFPAPGVRTVSAAANRSGTESRVQDVNAGVLLQETLGIDDKLFLTGGLRVDGNSAFGNEFSYQAYPKASVAYNISEESFWPVDFAQTMKLRVAFGMSGLAPSQFAADRTFTPISAQAGLPAVTPGNVGNPQLGPERSQELEVGFDAGFFENRLGVEFTAYTQKTVDALLSRPFPASEGFLSSQLTNIGEIQNRGVEVGLQGLVVQRRDLEWNAALQFSMQSNEVIDMGGIAPFQIADARIVEGYPVQGIWRFPLEGWDPETRAHTAGTEREFAGQIDPKWFGGLSSDISMGSLTFTGMMDFQGGSHKINFSKYWDTRVRSGDDYLALVERPTGAVTPEADSLYNYVTVLGNTSYVEPADFLSLRELSVSYQIPETLVNRLGLARSSVRFSGRNLMMWTRYSGVSPETNWRGGVSVGGSGDFDTQPPARLFLLTFRASM